MKLSCLPVSYFRALIEGTMTIPEWLAQAAALGLDGTDLSVLFFERRGAAMLRDLRTRIADAGLSLAILNTYPDLTHPDAATRQGEARQLVEDIRLASLLGAANVRVVAGPRHPETTRADGIRWCVEALRAASAAAGDEAVRLVFENHSQPAGWERPDFSFDPEVFLSIADGLAGSRVAILFDTANPIAWGAEPLAILERVIDRVTCVHAADTSVRGMLRPSQIGKGLVPFARIFRRLKQAGFDGWISIEEASGTGTAGMRQAVSAVQRAWAEA